MLISSSRSGQCIPSPPEAPIGPLRRRPVRQTREPCERRGDGSAIRKVRGQSIIAYTYGLGQRSPEFSPRSTCHDLNRKAAFSTTSLPMRTISGRPKSHCIRPAGRLVRIRPRPFGSSGGGGAHFASLSPPAAPRIN